MDQKTTAYRECLQALCSFLVQLAARVLVSPVGLSKPLYHSSKGEGEEVEFLLKGLKDSILGHIITGFHASSDSKVQNFRHAPKA